MQDPSVEFNDAPEQRGALEEIVDDPASRKRFLRMMGAGGAGALSVVIAACGSSKKSSTTSIPASSTPSTPSNTTSSSAPTDLDILNYALTLEHLETAFYKKVIAAGLFKGAYADLVKTFGDQERTHVAALQAAIKKFGGTPVKAPKTKFPLKDAMSVLKLAATVENLGAAAYLGQAGNIKNPEALAAALSIHTVEARHAATLNKALGKSPTPDGAFAKPADMATVLAAVQPFIVS